MMTHFHMKNQHLKHFTVLSLLSDYTDSFLMICSSVQKNGFNHRYVACLFVELFTFSQITKITLSNITKVFNFFKYVR